MGSTAVGGTSGAVLDLTEIEISNSIRNETHDADSTSTNRWANRVPAQ